MMPRALFPSKRRSLADHGIPLDVAEENGHVLQTGVEVEVGPVGALKRQEDLVAQNGAVLLVARVGIEIEFDAEGHLAAQQIQAGEPSVHNAGLA